MDKTQSGPTSRQRVRDSLSHKQPDRVVIDFGSTTSSGITAVAYNQLKKFLGIKAGPTLVYDAMQQLAIVEGQFLDLFGADLVGLDIEYDTNPQDWYPVTLCDGSDAYWMDSFRPRHNPDGSYELVDEQGRVTRRMPAGTPFFDQLYTPFADGYPENLRNLHKAIPKDMWGSVPRVPYCFASRPDFRDKLRRKGEQLKENCGRAIVFNAECNLFEWGAYLRRMDNFLMDLYLEPNRAEELMDSLLDWRMESLRKIIETVGEFVDVFRFADDLGMDNGPFMSPDIYRRFFKPRHKKLCDYVKKHTNAFTCLHSCGSIYELIPDLVDAGFDCLNPVQTSSANMEPKRLKREFGSEVVFWGGGCDTRNVLNTGSPEDVRRDVIERLEIFSPGGGFVFCPIHNILPDVPPQNITAMFKAVGEFNSKG
jgi:uroporphyrinogen decarboxylase